MVECVVFVIAECPIARKYAPTLAALARAHPKVRFRAVVCGGGKYAGLPFPVQDDRGAARRYGVVIAPTAVVLRDGQAVYIGRIDDRFPTLGVQREPRTHDLRDALSYRGRLKRTRSVGCMIPVSGTSR